DWKHAQQQIQTSASQELLPLYAKWHETLYLQLKLLWQYQQTQKFAKTHLERLDDKIEMLASQLQQNPNLSAQQIQLIEQILQYYQPHEQNDDFESAFGADLDDELQDLNVDELGDDEQRELQKAYLIEMICKKLGVDPEWIDFDFDPNDPQDLIQKLHQKIEENDEQFMVNHLNVEDREQYQKYAEREHQKQLKKQEKLELAKKMASKSMKSIYLKIVSIIHPDREQDEQKRIEKTELLQQANQALENKDLFSLLKIRGQVESDNTFGQKLANDQLKMYNLNLEDQVEQLQDKIEDIIYSFDWESSGFYKNSFKVDDLHRKYKTDLAEINAKLLVDEQLLTEYKDIKLLKNLLKSRNFVFGQFY
ncbi:MAG: molecular chaperone DnaJ, partial [Acinetobacter sp.]